MFSMLGIVRDSTAMGDAETSPSPPKRLATRKPMPYDQPSPDGKCHFLDMPEEVMLDIFMRLDLSELTRCFRLCKSIYNYMSESAAVNLRHTLLANSLRANPAATVANPDVPEQMPLNSSQMLAALRERLTRFHNLTPKARSKIDFVERSGSLYEYIEGVLLRSGTVGTHNFLPRQSVRSHKLVVYDLRKADEWEDEVGSDVELDEADEVFETTTEAPMTGDVRSEHTFRFEIMELAVDPGQDLLVLISLSRDGALGNAPWSMYIHLLSLSTYEPHPRAQDPMLKFPCALPRKEVHLDFQILDDMIHIMSKEMGDEDEGDRLPDHLMGWQWTTGRLCVMLKSKPNMSFRSFVMLTPWSYVVPTIITRLTTDADINEDLENIADLYWTLQLQLYSFPPISDNSSDTPHVATHVTTIDLPRFTTGIQHGLGPMAMSIRTDPPPRLTFPRYPLHAPPPFLPDPESGIAVIELSYAPWFAQHHVPINTRFNIIMLKSTLARYLPAPTSPLLTKPWSRPVPVIAWETIAPETRVFGPDCLHSDWVCYVYQNRYVRPVIGSMGDSGEDEDGEFDVVTSFNMQLLDFDQTRVRKEICDRRNRLGPDAEIGGDIDGISLVTVETETPALPPLCGPIRTGAKLPFLSVEREMSNPCPLIDSERILVVKRRRNIEDSDDESESGLEVMEF